MNLGVITPSGGIKTLDDLRQVIEAAIEHYETNKDSEDTERGTSDSVLFEFLDGQEFGYCGDCDGRNYEDREPERDPNG